MSAPRFNAVNWSPNEVIGEAKMDRMNDNMEWLRRNTPRVEYRTSSGLKRVENTKIAAGTAMFAKNLKSDRTSVVVRFDGFFSTACQPVITTGIVSSFSTRVFATTKGIGKLVPDHTGFVCNVNVDGTNKSNDKILANGYISWQAVGF